jgi:histidyl-tRNA synthetase
MFRYERPQKGRMREFRQIGVEAIGSDNPAIDAEVIWLLNNLFKNLGFKNLVLYINSIGCSECRKDYTVLLEDYLKPRAGGLCSDCANRIGKNTLRVFDCKVSECQIILKDAPKISDHLCDKCKSHLEDVFKILEVLDIQYIHNENLVRGFDYYTKTIFEIISRDIDSAQNALGGGGRYDNLIKEFGGPKISSIGFAIGMERTMLLMQDLGINPPENKKDSLSAYIINMSYKFNGYLFEIFKFLRQNKIVCDSNFNIKNIGTEIKWAKEQGYSHILIIGEDEVKNSIITVKDLNNYSQLQLSWLNEKIKLLNLFKKTDQKN